MNKLRINPRGNNTPQSKTAVSSTEASKFPTEGLNETLGYFLDKNINDFTKDDIQKFQNANQKQTDLFLDTSKRVVNKLFSISKALADKNNKVKENISSEDAITKDVFKIVSSLPETFIGLTSLITEVLEDGNKDNMSFLPILVNALVSVDEVLNTEQVSIENLYSLLSEMLINLQTYNITQQKYIYRAIASTINKKLSNYNLISPEDGNFVDPKFHKTISGSGQRIARGLSYILLDTNKDEVLKFGNVKTI